MQSDNALISYGFAVEKKGDHPNLVDQVHGTDIAQLKSLSDHRSIPADGVWTRLLGAEIYIFTADCTSILLQEPGRVAAVHAGWRGAKAGIVKDAVEKLKHPDLARAVLGPSIGSCCFEVKSDLISSFNEERGSIDEFISVRNGKNYFDLVGFVVKKEMSGLPKGNIDLSQWRCTFCSSPQLPSYRRNGNTLTRIRAWIRRDRPTKSEANP